MSEEFEALKFYIDLGLKLQDQSSFYWNFLVGSQIVIIGWVIEKGKSFLPIHRLSVAVVYLLFLLMNAYGLTTSNKQKDVALFSAKHVVTQIEISVGASGGEIKTIPEIFRSKIKEIPESHWYPLKFWLIWVPSNLIVFCIILGPVMFKPRKK